MTRPPLVLLGAGASKEAGVPLSFEMTAKLVTRLNTIESPWPTTREVQALNFACGALTAYDASRGANPYDGLDVERVFTAVELLARRHDLEVTPFVSAWHPAVDEWDRPDNPGDGVDQALRRSLIDPLARQAVSKEVARVVRNFTRGGSGEVYRSLMQRLITEMVALIRTTPKSVGHLSPLAAVGRKDGGITIATLNYDLSVEHAAEALGVPVATGIERWATHGEWSWPSDGVRLLKLHGSIDWVWEEKRWEAGQVSTSTVRRIAMDEPIHQPALVFGHNGKLRADGPFLSLLADFEAHLGQTRRLVIVGYSFRDQHINAVVRRWLADDRQRTLIVIDPSLPDRPAFPFAGFRDELLHALRPDDWGPESSFAARLTALRMPASQGLRHVFAEA